MSNRQNKDTTGGSATSNSAPAVTVGSGFGAAGASSSSSPEPMSAPAAAPEPSHLEQENAALRSQQETILDALISLQEEMGQLKAAQVGASAAAVEQNDKEAEFDAELEQLTREFSDYSAIEVFNRRALVGMDANLDIRLKGDLDVMQDPQGERVTWKLRWFNFGKEGRAQQCGAEGYLKVRWDDLADEEAITSAVRNMDEFVRKGDRGHEVLCKMPRKLYEYKKRRDAARQAGLLSSERGLRDLMANSVSAMAGARGGNADQAGSFIGGKGFSVSITPGERETFRP